MARSYQLPLGNLAGAANFSFSDTLTHALDVQVRCAGAVLEMQDD